MANRYLSRLIDLSQKALDMSSALAQRPYMIPRVVRGMLRGAHPSEIMRLEMEWLKRKGIKTIIDVGANTGQFSMAAEFLFQNAKIYAFEPLPACFKILQEKILNKSHVKAFNVAIGNQNSEETIWESSFAKSSSMLPMGDTHKTNFPWTAGAKPQIVRVAKLDDYLDEMEIIPPLLLKIDVQGYEDKVLLGASNILGMTDIIIIEVSFIPLYEDQVMFPQIYKILTEAGFEFAGNLGQRDSPIDGSILQADALFCRKK